MKKNLRFCGFSKLICPGCKKEVCVCEILKDKNDMNFSEVIISYVKLPFKILLIMWELIIWWIFK